MMMKNICLLYFLLIAVYASAKSVAFPTRQKININREWNFKLGDYKGAEKVDYNDKDWHSIHVPHNFSIPYFQTAHWYNGFGWYRKALNVPAQWKNKQVFVEFEAAFREAEIFINGQRVGEHKGGYTGFSIDITKYIKTGKNILAVRLNNEWKASLAPRNGDHNFVGGIYRDVYLVVTDPVHITWYGTYITTPELSKESGKVNIKTEIKNAGAQAKNYTVKTDILNASGKLVTTVSSTHLVTPDATVEIDQTTTAIKNPALWHPRHPNMYKAVSTVWDGKKMLDRYETPFGFRWMEWTADKGFFLNGEHYYFKGANVHQDHAGWANAITNGAMLRDIQMIKDIGMDFIRGSHYPHDPYFSQVCDSLGILLWQENDFWGSGGTQRETDNWYTGAGAYPMNEADQKPFEESVKTNLKEMIRIHRNHPSIIVWSMCNEPFFTDWRTMPKVREFLKELAALTHELEPSRPVGIGGCQRGEIDKLGDIAGYNGDGARLFINPGVPNIVAEYGSTIARRPGRYIPGWGDMAKQIDSNYAWRSGQAIWCAFDYGTRAGDFGLMGMVDYFRLPKNQWYWYRNEYMKIPPPPAAIEGTAAKLNLTANKKTINGTDGTDDVHLIVSVLNKEGVQLSNSPDVTLQVLSGPGEFPTGSSITFNRDSDIFIRDGKAAISFRSYYGGKTVIKATSVGLDPAIITIETKGTPLYKEGVTPKVADRPYLRYTLTEIPTDKNPEYEVNIAYQKPTRASSEAGGMSANKANDNDSTTVWQASSVGANTWWQLDMENLYIVSLIKINFASGIQVPYAIETSTDGAEWKELVTSATAVGTDRRKSHQNTKKIVGRFLRISFTGVTQKPISIREVEVFGRTSN